MSPSPQGVNAALVSPQMAQDVGREVLEKMDTLLGLGLGPSSRTLTADSFR